MSIKSNVFKHRVPLIIFFCLFLLVVLMLKNILFQSSLVLSAPKGDIFSACYYNFLFGFGELRHGHFSLWNPYVMSGIPFFASFQSALLYPPNIVYLVLSIGSAINAVLFLHIFLMGLFMFFWARSRDLHPLACAVAGVSVMFGAPFFLHIYPGHISGISSMIWVPLIFLSVDHLLKSRTLSWYLAGAAAVAFQVFGGNPQYVYYTAIVVAIYVVLHLLKGFTLRQILAVIVPLYIGGAALAAVQLIAGMAVTAESVRSSLSPLITSLFSLPPENLITILVPGFFGMIKDLPYWGRFYFWETNIFMGISGFAFIVHGVINGRKEAKNFSFILLCISLVLALGKYTPLHGILYRFLPYYDHFRGSAKFIFFASVFMGMLIAVGVDDFLRVKKNARNTGVVLACFSGLLACAAILVLRIDVWHYFVTYISTANTVVRDGSLTGIVRDSYLQPMFYTADEFLRFTARIAFGRTVISGIVVACASLAFFFRMRLPRAATYGCIGLAVIEIFFFAHSTMAVFDSTALQSFQLKDFVIRHPGDYRVLIDPSRSNVGIFAGVEQINGLETLITKRYTNFIAYTQHQTPKFIVDNPEFAFFHPFLKLLRCRYSLRLNENSCVVVDENKDYMARFTLIKKWEIFPSTAVLRAMDSPAFDPYHKALLESNPFTPEESPALVGSGRDSLSVIGSTLESSILEITVHAPVLLVISNTYNKGWRAVALNGSSQNKYRIVPADYILQAVPLLPGFHRIKIEYRPRSFIVGAWVSLVSLAVFLGLCCYVFFRRRRRILQEAQILA